MDVIHEIFTCFFLNENVWISITISLKFVSKGTINDIPALFQIMAWHRPDDKPLSGAIVIILLMHICITRPQRVYQVFCKHAIMWQKWTWIEPSLQSHNALHKYPTMHHFVTQMCTHAHFCYKMMHCGIRNWCTVGSVTLIYVLMPAASTRFQPCSGNYILFFKGETIHRVSRYISIQSSSSRYVLWYRKIGEDMYRFCIIYSIILRLLLKDLNIIKKIAYIISYLYRKTCTYRDTYRTVAIPYNFTPSIFTSSIQAGINLWIKIMIRNVARKNIPGGVQNPQEVLRLVHTSSVRKIGCSHCCFYM